MLETRSRAVGSIVVAAMLLLTVSNVVSASHLINWPLSASFHGRPDKGNFFWANVDESYLRWHGRVWWSIGNGRLGGLQQAYNQTYNPTMEYEGYNPGQGTDCDNLNWVSANSSLPRIGQVDVDSGDCPGNNSSIEEQASIRINGSSSGVRGDYAYPQYILFTKTYLNDYNPSWREVNLTYEERFNNELNLGKLKYDIRGTANGFPTNGRYDAMCSNPLGALHYLPGC